MDKIYVNAMQFYGYHGVFSEENKLGQRFVVDLVASISLQRAGESDNLEDSVNYGELYAICKDVVEGQAFKLIESVGEHIASKILQTYTLIDEVTVKVIKPDPPIPGYYQSVAVEITRRR